MKPKESSLKLIQYYSNLLLRSKIPNYQSTKVLKHKQILLDL